MHKKKNPLKVLSGELILNFQKQRSAKSIAIIDLGRDVVEFVKNSAELTIVRNSGATTEMIYHDLVPALLEAGKLGEVRKNYSDVTPLLTEEFDFSELDNQWHIRANRKIGQFIPAADRIRFYLSDYLRKCERDGKRPTFEDIIFSVMPSLINGETPSDQTILKELEKIAYSSDRVHWQLRTGGAVSGLQLPMQGPALPRVAIPTIDAHNAMIYMLAKLGASAGLAVYIGKRERPGQYNGEPFTSISMPGLPPIPKDQRERVEQIDCIWFYNDGKVAFAFEVEESTPITSGIDRFTHLLKVDNDVARRIAIVAPRRRRAKLDAVLRRSIYIGFPLYMENKLVYLFYDDVLKLYESALSSGSGGELLVQRLQRAAHMPRIGA